MESKTGPKLGSLTGRPAESTRFRLGKKPPEMKFIPGGKY
jgi:hypothetical protein